MVFITGVLAFCAILAPILARQYWQVLAAGVLCTGFIALIYWNALIAAGNPDPSWQQMLTPAARDGAVYTAFASLLYGIKRLVLSSTPQRPPRVR